MGLEREKVIEVYYGKWKKGLLGKQYPINLFVYPSHIEGNAFEYYDDGRLSNTSNFFDISYDLIKKIYIGEIGTDINITIEYKKNSVVQGASGTIVLMGIEEPQKWLKLVEFQKEKYLNIKSETKEKQKLLTVQKEDDAFDFYQKCYTSHINEKTPVYQLFTLKNKIAIIYIDENKGINFLKIDGYAKEENRGIISYNNIHYYEKAGKVHYTTGIHSNYSSFGGGITGGNFSKLATVGGGILFGLMGMTVGAALTYKPSKRESTETNFSIDSDIKTIDDRNVILNFYSDSKKQYVDIELPYDIYNFLLTYLPEKKYSIVDELEKKTVIYQSQKAMEENNLLKTTLPQSNQKIEDTNGNKDVFMQKIEKLKMMKDASLLSEEEFDKKRRELLDLI